MKLIGLNTVEELTIENMKLQYQIDKILKSVDCIDYVTVNGKQMTFSEFISDTVDIEPESITAGDCSPPQTARLPTS